MRERKYVKFRVDMYEDTKFKIIDMKPERDVIHYIWNRLVLLAGKVNLEGDLFLSKNIPYTMENLAIEFNREASQIKLALEVFIELEMIELSEDSIYRVKNFAKHQNIKTKKKEISKNEAIEVKNSAVYLEKVEDTKHELLKGQTEEGKEKDSYKEILSIADNRKTENDKDANVEILQDNNKDLVSINHSIDDNTDRYNLLEYNEKASENRNRVKRTKKKKGNSKADHIDELVSYDEIAVDVEDGFADGTRSLGKYETSIAEWSFG